MTNKVNISDVTKSFIFCICCHMRPGMGVVQLMAIFSQEGTKATQCCISTRIRRACSVSAVLRADLALEIILSRPT